MNYIKEFMIKNDLGIYDDFKIKAQNGIYYISADYKLYFKDPDRGNRPYHNLLVGLLNGEEEVINIFPKTGRIYYFVKLGYIENKKFKSTISYTAWQDSSFDFANKNIDNCFRTYQEAENKFNEYVNKINCMKFDIWKDINEKHI